MTLQFEVEHPVCLRMPEVLQIEEVFEEAGIQPEIDAGVILLPDGGDRTPTCRWSTPTHTKASLNLCVWSVRMAGFSSRFKTRPV